MAVGRSLARAGGRAGGRRVRDGEKLRSIARSASMPIVQLVDAPLAVAQLLRLPVAVVLDAALLDVARGQRAGQRLQGLRLGAMDWRPRAAAGRARVPGRPARASARAPAPAASGRAATRPGRRGGRSRPRVRCRRAAAPCRRRRAWPPRGPCVSCVKTRAGCVAGAVGSASTGMHGRRRRRRRGHARRRRRRGGLARCAAGGQQQRGTTSVMTKADLRADRKKATWVGRLRWERRDSGGARQLDAEACTGSAGQQRDAAAMGCNVLLHDRQARCRCP